MNESALPLNCILEGNCIEVLGRLPEKSVDLIFADPPYNLQLYQELRRPDMSLVKGVNDEWDQFENFDQYDDFTRAWLIACRRVLKDNGTLWVIGSYHNIFRIGKMMQDIGYWILNDVIWVKNNPMPNFRGVRFTNAHETLIWASKSKNAHYTFNHHAMKAYNKGKQMRSDWRLPTCVGAERIKINGVKAHATQKPEALLYRVILASSNPGYVVLDPFFGTGTTGAVAKKLHRNWIGIEVNAKYIDLARERIDNLEPESFDEGIFDVRDRRRSEPRIPFARLVESGYLTPGQKLYFQGDRSQIARIKPDGKLVYAGFEGSIHQVGKHIVGSGSCNGWDCWDYENSSGELNHIDKLRQEYRKNKLNR